MSARRCYKLELPRREEPLAKDPETISQSDQQLLSRGLSRREEPLDLETISQSEKQLFSRGDVVCFLNSIDNYLTKEQENQQMMWIAIFIIICRLFPDKCYKAIYMPALCLRINHLMAEVDDSFKLIAFMKGVYGALEENFLEGLWFTIYDAKGSRIEEYEFHFRFSKMEKSLSKHEAKLSFKSRAKTMIRTLEDIIDYFAKLPDDYNTIIRFLTPNGYDPPWFPELEVPGSKVCREVPGSSDEHLRTEMVINHNLTLKVKSVLDLSDSVCDQTYFVRSLSPNPPNPEVVNTHAEESEPSKANGNNHSDAAHSVSDCTSNPTDVLADS